MGVVNLAVEKEKKAGRHILIPLLFLPLQAGDSSCLLHKWSSFKHMPILSQVTALICICSCYPWLCVDDSEVGAECLAAKLALNSSSTKKKNLHGAGLWRFCKWWREREYVSSPLAPFARLEKCLSAEKNHTALFFSYNLQPVINSGLCK